MRILEKIIQYSLFLVLLLPLLFTKSTMFPWHFGKVIWFQVIIEILLFLAGIYLFFYVRKLKQYNFTINLLDILVLIFLLTMVLATIFGVNPAKSFWGNQARAQGVFTWLHFAVFYFLLRIFVSRQEQWMRIVEWVVYISGAASLFGWFAYLTGAFAEYTGGGSTIVSIFGNPIFFANYLIIPTFLAFWWWFASPSLAKGGAGWIFRRWLIFAIGCLNLLTLFFTGVRSFLVGLIVGLVVIWLGIFWAFIRTDKTRGYRVLGLGLAVLLVFISICVLNVKTNLIRENLPTVSRTLEAFDLQSSTAQTRLMAWQIAWQSFLDKPIFGWGPENFQDAFDKHYNPNFLKYSFAETVWDKPHNYFLEVLADSGLLGAAAYLGLLFYLLWCLLKGVLGEKDIFGKISLVLISAAVATYVVSLSFSFETFSSLLMWFFLLALANFIIAGSGLAMPVMTRDTKGRLLPAAILIAGIVALFFIPTNFTFYSASQAMAESRDAADIGSIYQWQKAAPEIFKIQVPFLSEQAIYVVKDLSTFDGNEQLDKKTLELVQDDVIKALSEEAEYDKDSYVARMWLGQFYAFLGEYVESKYFIDSEKMFEEAWQINRSRQQIPMLLSKTYLLQNKNDEAVQVLRDLVDKNPNLPEPHWFYGLALINKGDKQNGLIELEKGMPFGLGYKTNIFYLIDLYNQEKMYDKIVPLYQRLIDQEPDNAKYWASLAATYQALGDETNTLETLNRAVEIDPSLQEEAIEFLKMHNIKP